MASVASRLTSCFILVVSGFVFHSLAPPQTRGDIREGFESAENCWKLVQSDGRAEIRRQTRDLRSAHSGQASEALTVFTQGGSYAYLAYEIPPARLIDELAASIWLRCDRPGIQFAARIVLPHVQDDRTGRPVSLLVHGDTYERVGSWQQLRLTSLRRQFELKRPALYEQYGRKIDLREPYIDRLLINAHGGKALTNLWIDDLEVVGEIRPEHLGERLNEGQGTPSSARDLAVARTSGTNTDHPVDNSVDLPVKRAVDAGRHGNVDRDSDSNAGPQNTKPSTANPSPLRVAGSQILLRGRPWMPRISHWREEPLTVLKTLGFNALWSDSLPSADTLEEARQLDIGFIVPLDGSIDPRLFSPAVIAWALPTDSVTDLVDRRLQLQRFTEASRRPLLLPALLANESDPGEGIWVDQPEQIAGALHSGRPVLMATQIDVQQVDRTRRMAFEAIVAGARGLIFHRIDTTNSRDLARERFEVRRLQQEITTFEPWIAGGQGCEKLPQTSRDWECYALAAARSRMIVALPATNAAHLKPPLPPLQIIDPGSPQSADAYLVGEETLSPVRRHRVAGGVRADVQNPQPINVLVFTEDPLTVNYLGRSLAELARLTSAGIQRR